MYLMLYVVIGPEVLKQQIIISKVTIHLKHNTYIYLYIFRGPMQDYWSHEEKERLRQIESDWREHQRKASRHKERRASGDRPLDTTFTSSIPELSPQTSETSFTESEIKSIVEEQQQQLEQTPLVSHCCYGTLSKYVYL